MDIILAFLFGVALSALFYMALHKYKPGMEEMVWDFTASSGYPIPDKPQTFTKEEATHLGTMIITEVVELLQLHRLTIEEIEDVMIAAVHKDLSECVIPVGPADLLGEQVDACVDMIYYICDGLTKKGIDIYPFFVEVHAANMRKKVNGKFIRRADGKILKPEGWYGPNMTAVARKLMSR